MRVSKLEVFGFKSFVEKFVLEFDKDLICIVGPNGCGKSNIVDAIRWVLGETHAKQLRGGTLEDLIFNGSESRRAMGMAEVTLTIRPSEGWSNNKALYQSIENVKEESSEESEQSSQDSPNAFIDMPELYSASELQFTRRLYRSGESEFFINKVPCRLRDMVEVYRLLGVTARGLSIVQQGQIGELISKKPIERRELIEEAAGISGFRTRIESAQRRLLKTKDNLLRVSDIILEVEKQVRSLKRQAQRARSRQELKQNIKENERKLFVFKYKEFNSSQESRQNELNTLNASISSFKSNLSLNDAKQGEYRAQLHELDVSLVSLRQTREQLYRKISDKRDRLHNCELEIAKTRSALETLTSSLQAVIEREKLYLNQEQTLSASVAEIEKQVLELQNIETASSAELESLQKEVKESFKNNKLESHLEKNKELVSSINSEIKTVIADLTSSIELVDSSKYDLLRDKIVEVKNNSEGLLVKNEAILSLQQELMSLAANETSDDLLTKERSLQDEYRKAQITHAKELTKLNSIKDRIENAKLELKQASLLKESSNESKLKLEDKLFDLENDLNQIKISSDTEDEANIEYELELLDQRLAELENKRTSLTKELSDEMYGVTETRKELDELSSKESELKLSFERSKIELNMALESLQNKYGQEQDLPNQAELDTVLFEVGTDEFKSEYNSISTETNKLLKRLEREGEVDQESIALFEQENERLQTMLSEKQDLEKAVATLEKTIYQLKTVSKQRFLETFSVVSNKFKELIPRLFGGGSGQMNLINPEDALTSGVELSVRPPGKKITTMELLSGGEKALVATAVLISVFLYKPGPLCVLDEVDAPLDDANLERFLNLIREISDRTQFLMISHNKISMATADRLIGVTMQEKGMSTALSVDFSEAEAQIEKMIANA